MGKQEDEVHGWICGPRKVKDLVSLEDCFTEIKNALNYWYPLESDGATERECEARHDRLFSFYQKLRSQLEANVTGEPQENGDKK